MKLRKGVIVIVLPIAILILGTKIIDQTTPYKFPKLDYFPLMPLPIDNPVTVEGVELGRFLFYDTTLSSDYSFSCASCHKQKVAFTDSPNQFSKGINGELMSRNTLPLFNLAWYPVLFWDGKAMSIEEQVFHAVRGHKEMNLNWPTAVQRIRQSPFYKPKFKAAFGEMEIDSIHIARAIAQFERSLISNNSKYDQVIKGDAVLTPEEYQGLVLMNNQTKGDCLHCHTTDADALGTTTKFSNNGLDAALDPNHYKDKGRAAVTGKATDYGLFKIPSLRNVSVTAPYMHDGRFQTLEEVLIFYSEGVRNSYNIDSKMSFAHRGGAHLTEDEMRKIVAFLNTLTDWKFLSNPDFSNPFTKENQN